MSKKKILLIQPFYFYTGHYFQATNNLIKNLKLFKNYEFLVSINKNIKNKSFHKDFLKLKKIKKIHTFNSFSKSDSRLNIISSIFKLISLRNKFDVFHYLDSNIIILSYFNYLFKFFLKKNKINLFIFYGPEVLNKSKIKLFFFKSFLKNNNVNIYLRTKNLEAAWKKYLPQSKKKIKTVKSLDFPTFKAFKKNKKKKISFGIVGQIRDGKSIYLLNDYFKKNTEYKFNIIGGFANDKVKSKFNYLDKSFIKSKNFLTFENILKESNKLDYIILLYDHLFDHRIDISTLYLAVRLRTPVICFKKRGWLYQRVKEYNCGFTIKNFSEFKNFPKKNTYKYLSYIKGLKKFEKDNFNIILNEKNFYKSITK